MSHAKERIKALDVDEIRVKGELLSPAGDELDNAVLGAAAGYAIARGVAAVTGTGTVAHGLTAVVAVFAVMKDDASINAAWATAAVSGTTVTLKVWKPTSVSNPTPIASTTATNVHWLVIGTP